MKHNAKLYLIIAGALIVLGGIIFVITMSFLGWDFRKLSTVKYETNEYEISEDFTKIIIKTTTAKVVFLPSEDTKTKVVVNEQEKVNHIVKCEDGTLKIEENDTRKWHEKLQLFNFDSPRLTVYLSKSAYESLTISSKTGDIEVPGNFEFRGIDIDASTSDISLCASCTDSLKIKVSTGDISVDGSFYSSIDLSASTGDIELSNATCLGNIKLKVGTGKTTVNNVTCKDFESTSSTGKIKLNTVLASGKMKVTAGTGDITLDKCDGGEIELRASTGDITGTLLSDKLFDAHASTGDVSTPPSIKDAGVCTIKTSTGDIDIKLAGK